MMPWRPDDWDYGGVESVWEKAADAGMKAIIEEIEKHLQRGYASLFIEEAYWQELRAKVVERG